MNPHEALKEVLEAQKTKAEEFIKNEIRCIACGERVALKLSQTERVKNEFWFSTGLMFVPDFVEVLYHKTCEEKLSKEHEMKVQEERFLSNKKTIEDCVASAVARIDFDDRTADFKKINKDNPTLLMMKWNLDDPFGFIIRGEVGSGKSYVAAAFTKSLIQKYCEWYVKRVGLEKNLDPVELNQHLASEIIFVKAHKMFQACKSGDEFKMPIKFLKANYLIIDDLGTENLTEFKLECLYDLLDTRFTNKFPTFITTNLSLNQIRERFMERISSRILGMCIPIELTGSDRRLLKTKKLIAELQNRTN